MREPSDPIGLQLRSLGCRVNDLHDLLNTTSEAAAPLDAKKMMEEVVDISEALCFLFLPEDRSTVPLSASYVAVRMFSALLSLPLVAANDTLLLQSFVTLMKACPELSDIGSSLPKGSVTSADTHVDKFLLCLATTFELIGLHHKKLFEVLLVDGVLSMIRSQYCDGGSTTPGSCEFHIKVPLAGEMCPYSCCLLTQGIGNGLPNVIFALTSLLQHLMEHPVLSVAVVFTMRHVDDMMMVAAHCLALSRTLLWSLSAMSAVRLMASLAANHLMEPQHVLWAFEVVIRALAATYPAPPPDEGTSPLPQSPTADGTATPLPSNNVSVIVSLISALDKCYSFAAIAPEALVASVLMCVATQGGRRALDPRIAASLLALVRGWWMRNQNSENAEALADRLNLCANNSLLDALLMWSPQVASRESEEAESILLHLLSDINCDVGEALAHRFSVVYPPGANSVHLQVGLRRCVTLLRCCCDKKKSPPLVWAPLDQHIKLLIANFNRGSVLSESLRSLVSASATEVVNVDEEESTSKRPATFASPVSLESTLLLLQVMSRSKIIERAFEVVVRFFRDPFLSAIRTIAMVCHLQVKAKDITAAIIDCIAPRLKETSRSVLLPLFAALRGQEESPIALFLANLLISFETHLFSDDRTFTGQQRIVVLNNVAFTGLNLIVAPQGLARATPCLRAAATSPSPDSKGLLLCAAIALRICYRGFAEKGRLGAPSQPLAEQVVDVDDEEDDDAKLAESYEASVQEYCRSVVPILLEYVSWCASCDAATISVETSAQILATLHETANFISAAQLDSGALQLLRLCRKIPPLVHEVTTLISILISRRVVTFLHTEWYESPQADNLQQKISMIGPLSKLVSAIDSLQNRTFQFEFHVIGFTPVRNVLEHVMDGALALMVSPAFSIRVQALDVLKNIFSMTGWGADFMLHRDPSLILDKARRKALVLLDCDLKMAVRSHMEVILPIIMPSASSEPTAQTTGSRLTAEQQKESLIEVFSLGTSTAASAAVALALLSPTPASQATALLALTSLLGKRCDELPQMADDMFGHVSVSLMSICAEEKRWQEGNTTAFDRCMVALFALADTKTSVNNAQLLERVLVGASQYSGGSSRDATCLRLVKCIFEVVDVIAKRMGFENSDTINVVACTSTAARMLRALSLLVNFLGPMSARCIQKIPAILDGCAKTIQLIPQVVSTWLVILRVLPDDFVNTNLPSLAVGLLTLEQHCSSDYLKGTTIVTNLSAAALLLHERTAGSPFWRACTSVMSTSHIVRQIARATEAARAEGSFSVPEVMKGFMQAMASNSIKCKSIFLKEFHSYLSNANFTTRTAVTEFATRNYSVMKILVAACAETRADLKELALECIGKIGAIAADESSSEGADETDELNANCPLVFLERLLQWRDLVQYVLSVQCFSALGDTGNAKIHDRVAYAIQMLLRDSVRRERCESGGARLQDGDSIFVEELERYSWWGQLSPTMKKAFTPFTTTNFSVNINVERTARCPEFELGMTFPQWSFAWFCNLISKTQHREVGSIALAVRNTVRQDLKLSLALIPYLVCTVIMDPANPNDVTAVATEIHTVLAHGVASLNNACDEHIQLVSTILEHALFIHHCCIRVSRKLDRSLPRLPEKVAIGLCEKFASFFSKLDIGTRVRAANSTKHFARALKLIEGVRVLPSLRDAAEAYPLLSIFSSLDDQDSAREVAAQCRSSVATHGLISQQSEAFSHECSCDWALAVQTCEIYLQHNPRALAHQCCLLRCLRRLGEEHLLLQYGKSIIRQITDDVDRPDNGALDRSTVTKAARASPSRIPRTQQSQQSVVSHTSRQQRAAHRAEVQALINEAAWRLGEWNSIDSVHDDDNSSVGYERPSLAQPLQELMKLGRGLSTLDKVREVMRHEERRVVQPLNAASRENFSRAMPHFSMLHALADIETVAKFIAEICPTDAAVASKVAALSQFLDQRRNSVEAVTEYREPILSLHRVVYQSLGQTELVSQQWLEYSKLLKDGGHIDAAINAAHHSVQDGFVPDEFYTTMAKLLYQRDKKQGLDFAFQIAKTVLPTTPNLAQAIGAMKQPAAVTRFKMLLCYTRWSEELSIQPPSEVLQQFQTVTLHHSTEKAYFHLAKYHDTLYQAAVTASPQTSQSLINAELHILQALENYCKSVAVGTGRHSFASLPRLTTLWLDAAQADPVKYSVLIAKSNAIIERQFIEGQSTSIPARESYLILSQILSRLSHPNAAVVQVMCKIIVTVMISFPQQTLWQVLPVSRSQSRRSDIVKNLVITVYQRRGKEEQRNVENGVLILNVLKELCEHKTDVFTSDPHTRLSQLPFMKRVEKGILAANFFLPLSSTLFPDSVASASNGHTFHSFADRVEIMTSLQKPKKVGIIAQDGETYPFLCKAKDDPKKDIRMMEIVNLMNRLFLSNPESRRRKFALRRYVVAAISEDCAVIEWVNNQGAFRKLVDDSYAFDGSGIKTSQVKALMERVSQKNPTLTRMDMFTKHILVDAKPVFHQWFQFKFPSPSHWLEARRKYAQSCALWSAVGHIVGLGDRHGENILIDTLTGEAMHVDFACMFDKGEQLGEPERVRFRLTQNIVDGFGVGGPHTVFQSVMTISLRILMKHKAAVMCVLEALVHDPLIEWHEKNVKTDSKALFQRVSRRLDGYLDLNAGRSKEHDTLSLSAEGQAVRLIHHSSSLDNLTVMYIWWMAWI